MDEQTTKQIPLSGGLCAMVDAADYGWLSQWRWYAHRSGKNKGIYAVRHITLDVGRYTKISMHREIFREALSNGLQVDHRNGDGLDNRRANLRICTRTENARNRGMSRNNTVGLKGVRRNGNGFGAHIMADRKTYWLGTFRTPEQAHGAYCAAASLLHGDFYKSGCPVLPEGDE